MKKIINIIILILFVNAAFAQPEITINSNTKFKISGDDVFVKILDCNFTNNSSESYNFEGKLVFAGSSDQIIGGTTESQFTSIEIDNNNKIILKNNITIYDELVLTQGIIDIQDNNLKLSENAEIYGIFAADNMINPDSTGNIIKEVSSTGTYFFPTGDLTEEAEYSPVELDFTTGTFNNASISLNLKNKKHPDNLSPDNYLKRYWTVNTSGITDFNCDVNFTYTNEDIIGNEDEIYGSYRNGSNWTLLNQISDMQIIGNVNQFGNFTGGERDFVGNLSNIYNNQIKLSYSNGTIILFTPKDFYISYIEVYNSTGKLIKTYSNNNFNNNTLNFNKSSGIYLVKIFIEDFFITKKIIIN